MHTLFEAGLTPLLQGQTLILVVVTHSSGSTPRGAGSALLVGEAGRLAGTIGGGAIEYSCIRQGVQLLSQPRYTTRAFSLKEGAELGMVCGGDMEVAFLPLFPQQAPLFRQALERMEEGRPLWLLFPMQEGDPLALWPQPGSGDTLPPGCTPTTVDGTRCLPIPVLAPGQVYIFGGGHVAQALVPVLTGVEFPCHVVEDRPDFANRELFPQARQITCLSYCQVGQLPITEHDWVCIMTRGHSHDLEVLRQMLHTPARYIGLMGSRRKSQALREQLLREGVTPQDIARIVTPIGLPLGGPSPAEIAISIAAQLIQLRAAGAE